MARTTKAFGALCLTAALLPMTQTATALPGVGVVAVPVAVFTTPTYLTHAPGDPTGVYVTERAGTIKVARGNPAATTTFLDITTRVSITGEGGLLSVAFAPDYVTSGKLYVYYANLDGDIEIDEFTRNGAVADPASRRTVLVIPHRDFSNHYGAQLQFGPDGYLYIGTGDGGGGGDPLGNGQNLGALLGKMLRIDPRQSGTAAYTVPASNPFVSVSGARPEIWAYGLRNPFRFSFDRANGDLTIGDVGQSTREEVDYVPAGSAGGFNFGWNIFEGTFQFRPGTLTNHTPPVLERPRNMGFCTSITGGYVIRDPGVPSLQGDYVYGDYCTGSLRVARLQLPGAVNDRALNANVPNLSSFGEDAAGCVYAISLSGPVFRLVEDQTSLTAPCALPVR
ncbi:MAG TPA: PQQ-dependent sugar dehydrogenase [Frankiaceae bacterium]|nr:PQQ-dependent sugar dehydrogenase [Frankiaceae bacterium]